MFSKHIQIGNLSLGFLKTINKFMTFDILPSVTASSDFSDVQAELLSHIEILNHSALVSVSDLKGNIIHVNDLFCQRSQYSREEMLNRPHSIIRHPDTPPSVFKEMWRTIASGSVWQGELQNKAKDGSSYWVIATVAPVVGSNGKPKKYISIRYDVTSQKESEQELMEAKKKIDNELMENIAYAKHIHSSFLTKEDDSGIESFLIYRAQKLISGDFYKVERNGHKLVIALGDSTGHGISASYISLLTLNILSRTMRSCCGNPGRMLKLINSELNRVTHLNQEKQLKETADMILCCIDEKQMKMTYASARMRAFILRGEEIIVLEKDKCSIGECNQGNFRITNREIQLMKNDLIYIFSDGLIDQFGGPSNKRWGFKQVLCLIREHKNEPIPVQKEKIEAALSNWQGQQEQTDDITILGFRI